MKQENVQLLNDIKLDRTSNFFLQKSAFSIFFLFSQSQSWLWESTAVIFGQSAGYVNKMVDKIFVFITTCEQTKALLIISADNDLIRAVTRHNN